MKMNAKPWPGRRFLKGAIEKMKEVEKGRRVDELGCLVGILEGKNPRPIEKTVSFVMERMEEESIAAMPKVSRLVELKLVLKTKSRHDAELQRRVVVVKMSRREDCGDIRERRNLV